MKYGSATAWPSEISVSQDDEVEEVEPQIPAGLYTRKSAVRLPKVSLPSLSRPNIPQLNLQFKNIALKVALVAVAFLVVISLAMYGISQHSQLSKAHNAEATLSLKLKEQLTATESISSHNSDVVTQLTQAKSDLETKTATLQLQLDNRNTDVTTIKTCVTGLTKAISQATANDLAGAQATVASVSSACTKANQIS